MKIHYIAQYGEYSGNRNLAYSPAGLNKMKYIIQALMKNEYKTVVYSTCSTKSRRFYPTKKVEIDSKLSIIYRFTFGSTSNIIKLFELFINQLQLLIYLLLRVERRDVVLLYHERFYLPVVNIAKRIKNIKIVYEVEEIYTIVSGMPQKKLEKELKGLKVADAYIFSNDIMASILNFDTKPYIVSYGTYQVEENRNSWFNDDKIHVVYAGTLNPSKGGCLAAAAAAEYLPRNYHMHIIGFGTEEDKKRLLKEIEEISKRATAALTYDGLLQGDDYIEYLQKCHIGLSTQNPKAKFNDTSFPSKILSYMSNGLRVVSILIKAIEKSAIGNSIYYYEEQTPEKIADAIKMVDFNKEYDSRRIIKDLDKEFTINLKVLLEGKNASSN